MTARQHPSRSPLNWLAQASPDPEEALSEWAHSPAVLLPLGRLFTAVRIPGDLVHAAAGTGNAADVADILTQCLDGPVIADARAGRHVVYYALLSPADAALWTRGRDAECLGEGVYLSVPYPSRTEPPGPHWAVPPRAAGDLCDRESVASLVVLGASRLYRARR